MRRKAIPLADQLWARGESEAAQVIEGLVGLLRHSARLVEFDDGTPEEYESLVNEFWERVPPAIEDLEAGRSWPKRSLPRERL